MPLPAGIAAVLLDVEGTTTSIAFVYDVLFPTPRPVWRRTAPGPALHRGHEEEVVLLGLGEDVARRVETVEDVAHHLSHGWSHPWLAIEELAGEDSPFAHDAASRAAMAFSAAWDFGFQQVELQANVKQGVLVVASFNRFAAGDPRSRATGSGR